MQDGSIGILLYVTNGDCHYEKERVEVFGQGRTALIQNFRHTELWADGKKGRIKSAGSGKGHLAELSAFVRAVAHNEEPPLAFQDAVHTTFLTFAIAAALRSDTMEGVESKTFA